MTRVLSVAMMLGGVAVAVCGVGMVYQPLALIVGGSVAARVGLKMFQGASANETS